MKEALRRSSSAMIVSAVLAVALLLLFSSSGTDTANADSSYDPVVTRATCNNLPLALNAVEPAIAGQFVEGGIVTAATASTLTGSVEATGPAGHLIGAVIEITGGTGSGQTRTITASIGGISGTAESGTSNTLTDNSPSATPFTGGALVGRIIVLTIGPGAGDVRTITANTADTVTVSSNWSTNPNSFTSYLVADVVTVSPDWSPTPDTSSTYVTNCSNPIPTPGDPRTTTTSVDIPNGDLNFSTVVTFEPLDVEVTPGCNINTSGIGAGINDRLFADATKSSSDGIDNDNDGDTDFPTDSDGECLEPGDKVGGMRNKTTLGLANQPCGGPLDTIVDFVFYNIALPDNPSNPRNSTNIHVPDPEPTGNRFANSVIDNNSDLIADADSPAVVGYPDWLLDLFDPDWIPVVPAEDGPKDGVSGPNPTTDPRQNSADGPLKPIMPTAVYGGITNVGTTWTTLYFLQFPAGVLSDVDNADGFAEPHPYHKALASVGQPNQTILTDLSTAESFVSSITDFCSPLFANTMILGTSIDNGMTVSINPSGAGSHPAFNMTESRRDLDQDSYDNDNDTCPFVANIDGDMRVTDGPDNDMIDSACDISPGAGSGDVDADGFDNAQDNCPQVSNSTQEQAESSQAYNLTGTAESGTASTLTDNSPSAAPFGTSGSQIGYSITITGGTGAGQTRQITANTGDTVTVSPDWATDPDSTSDYSVIGPSADGGPKSDAIGDACDTGTAVFIQNRDPSFSGTATAGTNDTLTDGGQTFSGVDGMLVEITGGTGAGQTRTITSSTGTELTISTGSTDWDTNPDNTSIYIVSESISITASKFIANGRYHAAGLVLPACYGGTDDDGDGWCAGTAGETDTTADRHPSIDAAVTGGDVDGDGFDAFLETFMGTDPTKACNVSAGIDDEPVDALPTDFNDDRQVNVFDLDILKPVLFTNGASGGYLQRVDMNGDTEVNVFDLDILKPALFGSCSPIAQQ